jgi:hypothetical protein
MEFKSKKLIAMAGVVAVMATGCGAATNVDGTNDTESNAELDRFSSGKC